MRPVDFVEKIKTVIVDENVKTYVKLFNDNKPDDVKDDIGLVH